MFIQLKDPEYLISRLRQRDSMLEMTFQQMNVQDNTRRKNTLHPQSIKDRVKLGLYDTWLDKERKTSRNSFFIHKKELRGNPGIMNYT